MPRFSVLHKRETTYILVAQYISIFSMEGDWMVYSSNPQKLKISILLTTFLMNLLAYDSLC